MDICLIGVNKRIGKKREDRPWIEHQLNEGFKQWIIDFPKKQLPEIYMLLEKYKDNKNIVIFKSRKETDAYIKALTKNTKVKRL